MGYWAEPRDGRGDVNGLTAGYGFVPLKSNCALSLNPFLSFTDSFLCSAPVRMFTTAASGGAQALGRKVTNGEVVPINITKSGIPSSAAAVSGVYHADRATAANRYPAYVVVLLLYYRELTRVQLLGVRWTRIARNELIGAIFLQRWSRNRRHLPCTHVRQRICESVARRQLHQ